MFVSFALFRLVLVFLLNHFCNYCCRTEIKGGMSNLGGFGSVWCCSCRTLFVSVCLVVSFYFLSFSTRFSSSFAAATVASAPDDDPNDPDDPDDRCDHNHERGQRQLDVPSAKKTA